MRLPCSNPVGGSCCLWKTLLPRIPPTGCTEPLVASTPSSLSSHGLFEYFLPNILPFPVSSAPPLPSPLLHPGPLSKGWGARRFSLDRGLPDDLPSSAPPAPSDPRACDLHQLPSSPQPHLCFLPSQVWRHQRKGRLTPLPTAGPGPLCTSALGLVWALGQTLLRGPGGTGHRPTPITLLPPKGLFLPGALLAFCEGAWTRLEGSGLSAFC